MESDVEDRKQSAKQKRMNSFKQDYNGDQRSIHGCESQVLAHFHLHFFLH